MSIDWVAARDAFRSVLPLTAAVPPFGLVLGVFIAESSVNSFTGWASSFVVFAGSAQFASMVVLDAGGGVVTAVVTILVVNARHIIYSAALQDRFRDTPRWFKIVAPYFLIDQSFAVTDLRPETDGRRYRMTHYLVAGLTFWVSWNVMVGVGILAGNIIPESWDLGFAVPLLFIGLLAMSLKNRPGIFAAAIGGLAAVVARDLPNGSGLLVGAMVGIAAASVLAGTLVGADSVSSGADA